MNPEGMSLEDLLADPLLSMPAYDQLMRSANDAIVDMKCLAAFFSAEKAKGRIEVALGIPVTSMAMRELARGHARVLEALA